jgi:acetyl esterase/lipase
MKNAFLLLLLPLSLFSFASDFEQGKTLALYTSDAPFSKPTEIKERLETCYGEPCLYDVSQPTMTIYQPDAENNTGIAVVVLPGGGYEIQAIKHEGHDVAKYLASQGITGVVLKYRLPQPAFSNTPEELPITDVRRTLSLLREKADKYQLHSDKIGVMGFSAGSHLATVASLWPSQEDEKANFSGLIYGVSRLNQDNLTWLEESLYHRKMTEDEIKQNTLLSLVDKNTPPAFLVHAYDDDVCHVSESTLYADKLVQFDVPVEMHLFQNGGHGFGMGRSSDGTNRWPSMFAQWLKQNFN